MKALFDALAGCMALLSIAVLLYGAWLVGRWRIKPFSLRQRRQASPKGTVAPNPGGHATPVRSRPF